MTTINQRSIVPLILAALSCLVLSTPALAQTTELSFYADPTIDESTVEVYVELFDETDFSQWGGQAYHYNYSSDVYVSGDADDDWDAGSGLGPYDLEMGHAGDGDEFFINAGAEFECSAAGPLTAMFTPLFFMKIHGFNAHYNQIGEDSPYYEVDSNSSGRLCAYSTRSWEGNTATMTATGVAQTFVGLFGMCYTVACSPGHNGSAVGEYGWGTFSAVVACSSNN